MVMLWLYYYYVVKAAAMAVVSARRGLCYGCGASQERINMPVPMAPQGLSTTGS